MVGYLQPNRFSIDTRVKDVTTNATGSVKGYQTGGEGVKVMVKLDNGTWSTVPQIQLMDLSIPVEETPLRS